MADYIIVSPLGMVDQGDFYLAEAPARLGPGVDRVALKVVPATEDFERIVREVSTFARIEDPHLLRLVGAGQHEEHFFFATEWCERGPIDLLDLAPAEVRRAVAQAARGAQALHAVNVVHRNIRPRNVYVRADGSAVLADLSLVQSDHEDATDLVSTSALGFLDPALLTSDEIGVASDLFSLGATLHWLSTREHLYPQIDPTRPLMSVRSILRNPPNVRRDLCDPAVADLVAACVDPDVSRRPPSAAAFADRLDAIGDDRS
jgi:serine/threonine protein kinase